MSNVPCQPPGGSLRFRLQMFVSLLWLSSLGYLLLFKLYYSDSFTPKVLSLAGIYDHASQPHGDLLASLGFVPEPKLYPQSHHQGTELPVFALTLSSEDVYSFHRFLGSFRIYYREKRLVVYNIGLTASEKDLIRRTCQCVLREVHWERYPEHVKDLTLKAYRPLLIQETLHEFGAVFWCHVSMRFNSSNLDPFTTQAQHHGLSTWVLQSYPTSSLTHPHTLRYLADTANHFWFQRMAEPDIALYYNTYRLHHKLMMLWVKCVLEPECVAPQAAQPHGCHLHTKPRYLYTGCHLYDTSVFNVLLGQMFQYETPYLASKAIFQLERVVDNTKQKSGRRHS